MIACPHTMNAHLIFDFTIGHCNGSMSMIILANGEEILNQDKFEQDKFCFEITIPWPSDILIKLYNKGPNDTEVDPNGNILRDKFIKLEALTVDRMPLHILSLLNLSTIDTGTEQIKTNYWGFNGTVKLNFDAPDTMSWHLDALEQITDQDSTKYVVLQNPGDAGLGIMT